MIDLAVRLTSSPAGVTDRDIEALREVGFGDRAIHDIVAITSYFNFVNRIAQGLGVELEARFTDSGEGAGL